MSRRPDAGDITAAGRRYRGIHMAKSSYWEEGPAHQWIFCACDNSALDGLSEKVNMDEIMYASDTETVNLGIRKAGGRPYSGNYVGVCRLKGVSGRNLLSLDGREVILKIEPRFPVSVVEMLNALREDDEFERYLAPQTNRLNEADREIEDLSDNELFRFFTDEDPVFLRDRIACESSIITASVFITMLKRLCSRPLMGRMVCREENLVGKAKGKIVFEKNIQKNTLRGRDDRLCCRYLQYSEDILENQILKAALHKTELFLGRYFGSATGNRNSFREMLSCCRSALAHVSYVRISRADLNKIRTTGVYAYYRPVIHVAKMILHEITLEAGGDSAATGYVVPWAVSMERLFEIYVRAFLKQAGVRSHDSEEGGIRMLRYDDKTAVLKEKDRAHAGYIRGNIRPDIVICDPDTGAGVVFDVKYKDVMHAGFSRADRLQILAYGLMLGCSHVGNIFPAHSGTDHLYYESNEIESNETRTRFYDQMEVAIDAGWKFEIRQKDGGAKMHVMDYLKRLLADG